MAFHAETFRRLDDYSMFTTRITGHYNELSMIVSTYIWLEHTLDWVCKEQNAGLCFIHVVDILWA